MLDGADICSGTKVLKICPFGGGWGGGDKHGRNCASRLSSCTFELTAGSIHLGRFCLTPSLGLIPFIFLVSTNQNNGSFLLGKYTAFQSFKFTNKSFMVREGNQRASEKPRKRLLTREGSMLALTLSIT